MDQYKKKSSKKVGADKASSHYINNQDGYIDTKTDSLQNLLNMHQFDSPVKKKPVLKTKENQIDVENDSHDEIIKKLIKTIHRLENELNEYKIYAEGTYCTTTVHNRAIDDLDTRVTDIRTQIDEM